MTRAVLPRATAREVWLLAGHAEREGNTDVRLQPLDDDGESECGEDPDTEKSEVDGAKPENMDEDL